MRCTRCASALSNVSSNARALVFVHGSAANGVMRLTMWLLAETGDDDSLVEICLRPVRGPSSSFSIALLITSGGPAGTAET